MDNGLPTGRKKDALKQARMVHWKKWAAKHTFDELKEFGQSQSRLRGEDTLTNHGSASQYKKRNWLWKEDGCRKDCRTLGWKWQRGFTSHPLSER